MSTELSFTLPRFIPKVGELTPPRLVGREVTIRWDAGAQTLEFLAEVPDDVTADEGAFLRRFTDSMLKVSGLKYTEQACGLTDAPAGEGGVS